MAVRADKPLQSRTNGAQSVRRAVQLLREVAAHNRNGLRLVDAIRNTRLDRSTVHRILRCLVEEKLIAQDSHRRYFLGGGTMELGLCANSRFNIRDLCEPSLVRLAQQTDDVVFLSVRDGLDMVCLDRKEGNFPIKTFTLEVGDRRPLGVNVRSVAILCELPAEEVRRIVTANAARLNNYTRSTPKQVIDQIEHSQRLGYVVRDSLVSGVRDVALAIHSSLGAPFAALSISAISNRMTDERLPSLLAAMRAEVLTIERLLMEENGISAVIDAGR
jgi:DNA-binding IclR family transcriptional regulator